MNVILFSWLNFIHIITIIVIKILIFSVIKNI